MAAPYASDGLPPPAPVRLVKNLDEVKEGIKAWNEFAARNSLPLVQVENETRRRSLAARLKDAGGIEGWKAALQRIEDQCRWMITGSQRGWVVTFDALLRPQVFTRLMEGNYDERPGNHTSGAQNGFIAALLEDFGRR